MNLILPEVKSVTLEGFYPIFQSVIEFDINSDFFILLGGNGLGKTTILQALVYGVAGGANNSIEPDVKERRWDYKYFQQRLDDHENAFVCVSFRLAEYKISLKRGFRNDQILELVIDGDLVSNLKSETKELFENFLIDNAGYNSIEEFSYVFHQLCYLSEHRENLAWDIRVQTRLFMHVFSDVTKEELFRSKGKTLKNLDSKIRHKNVEINDLKRRLELLNQSSRQPKEILEQEENLDLGLPQINIVQDQLAEVNQQIRETSNELKTLRESFSSKSDDIANLREELQKSEEAFILGKINEIENQEAQMAIHKLIHYKTCPACGNLSEELHKKAVENLNHNNCPLCASESNFKDTSIQPGLQADLSEKIQFRVKLEEGIILAEQKLDNLSETGDKLNSELNQYLINRKPTVVYLDKNQDNKKENPEDLVKALINLEAEYNELNLQFNLLRKELSKEYETFERLNNQRVESLGKIYAGYATSFLGIACELEPYESRDNFLDLKLFVPSFGGKVRREATSCSEAQRFFLDIAFRMAIIDLIRSISGHGGTFICETPENALDITYINNVTEMFYQFSIEGHNNLVLSNNIQFQGLAYTMLTRLKDKSSRPDHFLNMINIGRLSDVQASETGHLLLEEQIEKILKDE